MTEFERPGLGAVLTVTQADEDAAVARLRARRRRRSASRGVVAASVVALTALVSATTSGGATDSVETVAEKPSASEAARDAFYPAEPRERDSDTQPAVASSSEPDPAPSSTPPPDPAPTPPAPPPPPPPPPPSRAPEPAPLLFRGFEVTKDAAPLDCGEDPEPRAGKNGGPSGWSKGDPWCVVYAGPSSFRYNVGGEFATRMCRDADDGEGKLTRLHGEELSRSGWASASFAPSEREQEHARYHGEPIDYRSGYSYDVPSGSTIVVPAGACATWSWSWKADLAPHTYDFRTSFIAENYRQEFGDFPHGKFRVSVVD